MEELEGLTSEVEDVFSQLLHAAGLEPGEIVVVGCSTSEILGEKIGTASNLDIARAVLSGFNGLIQGHGLWLAIQACEHLNRSLVVEKECMHRYHLEQVSVVPAPEAGGALSVVAFEQFATPVMVESIQAHAAVDIGDTFVGMHLRKVVVPVRVTRKKLGNANLNLARTRPKYIGGERARYQFDIGK